MVGGRSAGARSAARCAIAARRRGLPGAGLPAPPARADPRSRGVDELTGAGVPTLVVQGERDSDGPPEEFPEGIDLAVVPAADHGLKVPRVGPLDQAGRSTLVVESTLEWLVREVVGNP